MAFFLIEIGKHDKKFISSLFIFLSSGIQFFAVVAVVNLHQFHYYLFTHSVKVSIRDFNGYPRWTFINCIKILIAPKNNTL